MRAAGNYFEKVVSKYKMERFKDQYPDVHIVPLTEEFDPEPFWACIPRPTPSGMKVGKLYQSSQLHLALQPGVNLWNIYRWYTPADLVEHRLGE